jgi:hypothetical protein
VNDLLHHAEKFVPGLLGSMAALLWLEGNPTRKLGLFVFGVAVSYYFTPWLASESGVPESVTGLTVGLFGMSVVDSIFKVWTSLGLTSLVREWVRARLGLPKE